MAPTDVQRPRGHFVPSAAAEPTGHFIPTGDPQVQALAQAASEHAKGYVDDVLDPQMAALRQQAAGVRGGGRVADRALDDVIELQRLVRTLPGMMSVQIGFAPDVESVEVSPVFVQQISRMQSTYPWMAPRLVRLRHALSQQALEDNVAIPAGRQIGLG